MKYNKIRNYELAGINNTMFNTRDRDKIFESLKNYKLINDNMLILSFESFFNRNSRIFLTRNTDDWYYVRHIINSDGGRSIHDVYQCDQLDGLIECLKFVEWV